MVEVRIKGPIGRPLTRYERNEGTTWDPAHWDAAAVEAYKTNRRPVPPQRFWCDCGADFLTAHDRDEHTDRCVRPPANRR